MQWNDGILAYLLIAPLECLEYVSYTYAGYVYVYELLEYRWSLDKLSKWYKISANCCPCEDFIVGTIRLVQEIR